MRGTPISMYLLTLCRQVANPICTSMSPANMLAQSRLVVSATLCQSLLTAVRRPLCTLIDEASGRLAVLVINIWGSFFDAKGYENFA